MRRALFIAVAAGLIPASAAHGHAVVQPSAARPADPQVYRVTVPNEMESPTVEVRLRVPKGIDFALLESAPAGWKGEIVRKGDVISEIRWSGGEIPPEQYGTFRFLVRNPVEEGEITWPIVQRYEDGSVQRWIGPQNSDEPASRTQISESATPEDIIAVNGEKLAQADAGDAEASPTAASAPAAAGADDDEDESERDPLALGLAGGALIVALIALAGSLRRRTS
jgi:uncharacterized protein YcnI